MLLTIIVFLLILSVLVLIHEFGHYITAKKLGVKVEEFGFGFPLTPPIFSVKVGETKYSFYPALIGGFVKLYGEDDAGSGKVTLKHKKTKIKEDKRAFYSRPVWQKAIMVAAGVFMNFLLAVAITTYLFAAVGIPTPGKNVTVVAVIPNSPAALGGIKTGDTIISVNGLPVTMPSDVISITQKYLGKQMTMQVKDTQGLSHQIIVTPRLRSPKGQGPMGVAISPSVTIKKYSWYQAPIAATIESLKDCWLIITGIGMTIAQLFITHKVPAGVAGPVGIAQLTGQFVQQGVNAVLSLVTLLSLNLAVLNILPIPALDGGRLFFILIEGLTGKKINPAWEANAHNIGMLVLLALIVLVTLHDILRLISGQPLLPKM